MGGLSIFSKKGGLSATTIVKSDESRDFDDVVKELAAVKNELEMLRRGHEIKTWGEPVEMMDSDDHEKLEEPDEEDEEL